MTIILSVVELIIGFCFFDILFGLAGMIVWLAQGIDGVRTWHFLRTKYGYVIIREGDSARVGVGNIGNDYDEAD